MPSRVSTGEGHDPAEESGSKRGKSSGVWGTECWKGYASKLGDPTRQKTCRYKAKTEKRQGWEEVGGGHSTDEGVDNKTTLREGPLLQPCVSKKVGAGACPKRANNSVVPKREAFDNRHYAERPRGKSNL